jgi:hypothetical protein
MLAVHEVGAVLGKSAGDLGVPELGERTSPQLGFGGVGDDCRDLGLIGGAQLGIDTVEG